MIRTFITCILAIALMPCSGQGDDILMVIGGEPVTLSEFTYIYEKNNRESADYSRASLNEYIELYANFKLKVRKAKEEGYHIKQSYIDELAGYRQQLSKGYVYEREVVDFLVYQMLERGKTDIEASHILISLSRNASESQQKEALAKIKAVQKLMAQGNDFTKLATELSEDVSSGPYGGSVGYLTSPLPNGYIEFEDAIYALQPGEVSDIVRTDLGYHIVKVTNQRPARGSMQARHILVRNEKRGIPLASAALKIKEIYQKVIKDGVRFEDVARSESEDLNTAPAGGMLGNFGIGQYERPFEDVAFGLENDGDISEPVQTSIGWHIIQRISKNPPVTEVSIRSNIKGQLAATDRVQRREDQVVESIKKTYRFAENAISFEIFKDSLDATFAKYDWQPPAFPQRALFSLGDQAYEITDFAEYCKANSRSRLQSATKDLNNIVDQLYMEFIQKTAIQFAESRLEEKYPAFRNLMREYEEGILLFEITREEVWDKASRDTTGLRLFYETNRDKYQWGERVEMTTLVIPSTDMSEIGALYTAMQNLEEEDFLNKYNGDDTEIEIRTDIFEKDDDALKGMTLSAGYISKPVVDKVNGKTHFDLIKRIIPPSAKTLKEARGYIVSDYQDQLEKEWVEGLKREFEVTVNEKNLENLVKADGKS